MSSDSPDECEFERLEAQLPAAAGIAFSNAYHQALGAGLSVMVADNGAIYEVFPDGHRRLIKKIAPPIPTQAGVKIKFK